MILPMVCWVLCVEFLRYSGVHRYLFPPQPRRTTSCIDRSALRDVVLSFAGWLNRGHPVHRAIAALAPGDALQLRVADDGRRELLDQSGTSVGRLAKDYRIPAGKRLRSAEVRAIVGWSRELSDPKYRDRARCEEWEVVVPRLVFAPEGLRPGGSGDPVTR